MGGDTMWTNLERACTRHYVLNDCDGERIIQHVTVTGDRPVGDPPRWEPFTRARASAQSRHDRQLRRFLARTDPAADSTPA